MDAIRFQPQNCRFFLLGPFSDIITDHLQSLPFEPINGVQLNFQCGSLKSPQAVAIEIDPRGNLAKVSVIDSETQAIDLTFDFINDSFTHYGEPLPLICGHPQFHQLQQTIPVHFKTGCYTVKAIAL